MDKGKAISMLKERMASVTPLPDEPDFTTSDETIVRYLKSFDWRYKEAEKALLTTVEYRREMRPLTLDCRWCHERPGFHSMRQVGHDESGRPVVYANFGQASTRKNTVEDSVAHVTYLIENATVTMEPGTTTWVFIIDCSWMTLSVCNPKLGYGVTNILANHYPERLGMVICVNHNPVFHGVWKALKKLLSPSTVAKVKLVRSESKIHQLFSTYFSDELTSWLEEEIKLNRQKPFPQSQREFWNPPQAPSTHDPRGCPSYVKQYVRSFKPEMAKFKSGQKKVHCPHPNIIDALTSKVVAVAAPEPLEDDHGDVDAHGLDLAASMSDLEDGTSEEEEEAGMEGDHDTKNNRENNTLVHR